MEYLEALIRYMASRAESLTLDVILEALPKSIKDGGDIMATLAQQWMQQGRQEERESKDWMVVKSSLSMGFSLETMAKLTGLTVKRIQEMIAQIDQGKK